MLFIYKERTYDKKLCYYNLKRVLDEIIIREIFLAFNIKYLNHWRLNSEKGSHKILLFKFVLKIDRTKFILTYDLNALITA